MRATDVMTTEVITVHPDTSVQAVAKLLCERGISGVPVVDAADRLIGIVSEGDLLHRSKPGPSADPIVRAAAVAHGGWTGSVHRRNLPETTSSRTDARQRRS